MARRKKATPTEPDPSVTPVTADGLHLLPGLTVYHYDPRARRLCRGAVLLVTHEGWDCRRAVLDDGRLLHPSLLYGTEAAARAGERKAWAKALRYALAEAAKSRRHLDALARKPRTTKRTQRKGA